MSADQVVKFRVSPDLKERIDRAARGERRKKSDLLRLIIEDWLDQHRY